MTSRATRVDPLRAKSGSLLRVRLKADSSSEVLAPFLREHGIYTKTVIVKTSMVPGSAARRGGGRWRHYRKDILGLLGATQLSGVTTVIDFYGYPEDAPGYACRHPHRPRECAAAREDAMSRDIGNPRFIPHLVLHEFETWVIASVAVGADSLIPPEAAARLRPHIESVSSDVELLDDSPTSAQDCQLG